MKEIQIGYLTDNPSEQYASTIRSAKTRAELIAAIVPYKRVADDALDCATKFTDQDFSDFLRDLPRAKRKQSDKWIDEFNRRFGAIAMPMKLVISTLVAQQFLTPWGAAFIRCEEEGWPMLKETKSE